MSAATITRYVNLYAPRGGMSADADCSHYASEARAREAAAEDTDWLPFAVAVPIQIPADAFESAIAHQRRVRDCTSAEVEVMARERAAA